MPGGRTTRSILAHVLRRSLARCAHCRAWSVNEFEEAATRAIAAERAAEAIKVKAAAMAKAMGAVKAKAADEWTCADRIHKSQWISVMMQWYEMTDILAELAECKMQKLE